VKGKVNEIENILCEIIAENFPSLGKDRAIYAQAAYGIPK
jgi:hypothetical protein